MSFGFLLTPLQASLLASTLGNYNGNDDGEVDDIIKWWWWWWWSRWWWTEMVIIVNAVNRHHYHNVIINYCIPFRYQMPANVKKRAITAGLIGRKIQQWLFIGKKLWKRTNSIFFCYRLFFLAQEQNPIKSFSHLGNRRPRPLWGKAWNVFVLLGDTFTLSEEPIKLFHKT